MKQARYIVDLEGFGRMFRMTLQNLGISSAIDRNSGEDSHLNFVYKECVDQAMLIMGGDMTTFITKLTVMPEISTMRHIPMFSDHASTAAFATAFREFAFMLASILQRKIGFTNAVDYYLEAVTEDYMVVNQVTA